MNKKMKKGKDPYGLKDKKSYFGIYILLLILVIFMGGILLIKIIYTKEVKQEEQLKVVFSKEFLSGENLKNNVTIPTQTQLTCKSTDEIEKRDELYNVLYQFARLINEKQYDEAYAIIDHDVLNLFDYEFTLEEFTSLVKDTYPKRVSLELLNYMEISAKNKPVDYIMCMVRIEAAHYGDEEVEDFRSTIVDYSLIRNDEGFKLLPFSLSLIDEEKEIMKIDVDKINTDGE